MAPSSGLLMGVSSSSSACSLPWHAFPRHCPSASPSPSNFCRAGDSPCSPSLFVRRLSDNVVRAWLMAPQRGRRPRSCSDRLDKITQICGRLHGRIGKDFLGRTRCPKGRLTRAERPCLLQRGLMPLIGPSVECLHRLAEIARHQDVSVRGPSISENKPIRHLFDDPDMDSRPMRRTALNRRSMISRCPCSLGPLDDAAD